NGPRPTGSWTPISTRRTYFKPAGTYTFRLEAYGAQNAAASNYFSDPMITAEYFPTPYGAVTTALTADAAGGFSPLARSSTRSELPGASGNETVLVDLRELETRAATATAAAERAQRELLEARLKQQLGANAARVATAGK